MKHTHAGGMGWAVTLKAEGVATVTKLQGKYFRLAHLSALSSSGFGMKIMK